MGIIVAPENLEQALAPYREKQQIIVSTNGCFDLLHIGHLRYLQKARSMGDMLVVAINSDDSVQALKGPNRPVTSQDNRAELLAGLACVDMVTIFDAPTPEEALKTIHPTIHVKGGDYTLDTLPEAPTLKTLGTKVEFVSLEKGFSTTHLIEKIVKAYS